VVLADRSGVSLREAGFQFHALGWAPGRFNDEVVAVGAALHFGLAAEDCRFLSVCGGDGGHGIPFDGSCIWSSAVGRRAGGFKFDLMQAHRAKALPREPPVWSAIDRLVAIRLPDDDRGRLHEVISRIWATRNNMGDKSN